MFAIANALRVLEPARAWEVAFDAVKAANSAEKFTGEDALIYSALNSSSRIFLGRDPAPDFDIPAIVEKPSTADADRTIELARGFQDEDPRAIATITIATALLKSQSRPENSGQAATTY